MARDKRDKLSHMRRMRARVTNGSLQKHPNQRGQILLDAYMGRACHACHALTFFPH